MKITDFQPTAIHEFRYLNAGKGAGSFYADRLPVHHARVDELPEGVDAIVVTADLQGRELFQEAMGGSPRLLGEVIPRRLIDEVLPSLNLNDPTRIGAWLAGDFYTVPALDKRGGTGDVTSVWRAFGDHFAWVAGVAGNHDTFGGSQQSPSRISANVHYLDGDTVTIAGLRVAGIGGIIGNPTRVHRRLEEDYLETLELLLDEQTDVVLMHEGPDGTTTDQRGNTRIRELLEKYSSRLIVRGHAHWQDPFAEFTNGLQVLNVDARVVILTE